MQIGIRLHDVADLPLEQILELVRKQGFCCGHLAIFKLMKDIPKGVTALTPGFACYLRKLFMKYDLDIAVLGCYLNLADPDFTALSRNVEQYMAHIRFASLLGCGVVGTETGAPNSGYVYEPACHTDQALELFIKNLRPIVSYAEKMGVILAIEPVYRHIVWNPKCARKVLDEIDSPNLQIIFDPVNLLDTSNLNKQDELFEEAITLLGKEIAVIHLKDYIINEKGSLVPVAAGTGNMDYRRIMNFIKEEKPYIHVILENTVADNAESARKCIVDLSEA